MTKKKIKAEIRSIVQQIAEKYGPEKIILFGSAARNRFGANSDIDLLILKKDVPARGIDRMRQLRHLLRYKIATDLLIYHPDELKNRIFLNDPFVKNILKQGKVVYEKK